MTIENQVKNILMTLPTSDSGNYYHDDLVQAFTAFIRAQWEQTVKELETRAKDYYAIADTGDEETRVLFMRLGNVLHHAANSFQHPVQAVP